MKNIDSHLMTALLLLASYHGLAASILWLPQWLPLSRWTVVLTPLLGILLGFAGGLLLVMVLSWLRGLWWAWANRRMSKPAPAWLVWLLRMAALEPFGRGDEGV